MNLQAGVVVDLLSAKGITVIGPKYRTRYGKNAAAADALADGARAVRIVRSKAKEWQLDPNRIGIQGYSAGANLCLNLLGNFDEGNPKSTDPIETLSSRPFRLRPGDQRQARRTRSSPRIFHSGYRRPLRLPLRRIKIPGCEMAGSVSVMVGFGENVRVIALPGGLDKCPHRNQTNAMELLAIKRPLESEGIPPLIEDPQEALKIFGELLRRGATFYPEANETSQRHPRIHRIVPLSES